MSARARVNASVSIEQIRVSDDYAVDLTSQRAFSVNLYTGTSSMLAAALGLAPSKDVFWTTPDQPGYPSRYAAAHEAHPALEAAIATFSAGPVAPGDKVG